MKRNLFWGLLGLMLALLGFSNATGPPLTAVASHETVSMPTNADGTLAPANNHPTEALGVYQEGAATGVFNGASPLDASETAVLMSDPTSGYHDTGQFSIEPAAVAEPLIAFTVRRADLSVVRLN